MTCTLPKGKTSVNANVANYQSMREAAKGKTLIYDCGCESSMDNCRTYIGFNYGSVVARTNYLNRFVRLGLHTTD